MQGRKRSGAASLTDIINRAARQGDGFLNTHFAQGRINDQLVGRKHFTHHNDRPGLARAFAIAKPPQERFHGHILGLGM